MSADFRAIGRPQVAILLGSLIVLTAIGAIGVTRLTTQPPGQTGQDRLASARVEGAMKELDLIRPSPQKVAEDFLVKTPDGGKFRLSEQRGQVVFINFWATWCPPCREEMPALERLFQRTKKAGLVMLAVSVDADSKVVAPFLTEHRFTFAVGLDPKMRLADAYGVRALPASFIVDREGRLAALALGPREWDNAASQAVVEGIGR